MVNMPQSSEYNDFGTGYPLVHFDCQPQRRENIGIANREEGWGRDLIEPVESIMECAGITDILTKSLGSTNPHNMVLAALDGLKQLTTVEEIARERGVEVSSIGYRSRAKVREAQLG